MPGRTRRKDILIVQPDPIEGESLRAIFHYCGYESRLASNVDAAFTILRARQPDLLLVDLDDYDVGRGEWVIRLRSFTQVPLIVLSARTDEDYRVALLDGGADDVIVKPYRPRELASRVRSKLRMGLQSAQDGIPDFRARHRLSTIHLSKMERALLSLLTKQMGKTVPEHRIIGKLWGAGAGTDIDLRVLVLRLRRKLQLQGEQLFILNERGVGYYLSTWENQPPSPRNGDADGRGAPSGEPEGGGGSTDGNGSEGDPPSRAHG